mmetsp:Transcript_20511/g.44853  ORF Transcript_20511/g.44853 Transcript_20511/m.44853 type:complete len:239 (-) Transcript_20511:762-1478(-)
MPGRPGEEALARCNATDPGPREARGPAAPAAAGSLNRGMLPGLWPPFLLTPCLVPGPGDRCASTDLARGWPGPLAGIAAWGCCCAQAAGPWDEEAAGGGRRDGLLPAAACRCWSPGACPALPCEDIPELGVRTCSTSACPLLLTSRDSTPPRQGGVMHEVARAPAAGGRRGAAEAPPSIAGEVPGGCGVGVAMPRSLSGSEESTALTSQPEESCCREAASCRFSACSSRIVLRRSSTS